MQEPKDQEPVEKRMEQMKESIEGVGDGLEILEKALDLEEMTEGPTKNLIRSELGQLLCSSKLMKAALGRLRNAILTHYGVGS